MRYCLFPFFDQYQLLSNRFLLDGSIDYIMPLKSWEDSVMSSKRCLNDVQILPLSEDSIKYYDAIIILPFNASYADKIILDFVFTNLKNKKKVYNFHSFPMNACSSQNEFSHIKDITLYPKVNIEIANHTITPINATVIYNTSIAGSDYHTDVEFFLYRRLTEIGANVCVISASPFAELYGYVPFPINELQKISLYESAKWINKFVNELEKSRKPDIFIISIPEPVTSYNPSSDNFGIINFICTNAVLPDYTILNITLDNYSSEMLDKNIILSQKKLSCGVDAIVLSDLIFDSIAYSENITPLCEFFRGDALEQACICDRLNESPYHHGYIYNNQKKEDMELLFQKIISKVARRKSVLEYERVL